MRTGTCTLCIASALAFVLAAPGANAAGRSLGGPGPFSPVPVANWSGFYAGGNLGATWGYFTNNFNVGPGPFGSDGGVSGGVQAGYNVQRGRWVFGAEGDFSLIDVKASTPRIGSFTERWTSSLRGRVGYAVENYLAYLTGGIAFTDANAALTQIGNSGSDAVVGFTAGFGFEKMVMANWSVRAEALYTDVPKHTFNILGVPMVGGSHNYTVRAAANYWFH